MPDANENEVTLLPTNNANERIKTSQSNNLYSRSVEFNFFLQLPTQLFEYLCEWLDGDDIFGPVHCGCRSISARLHMHANKLVFNPGNSQLSASRFVRELEPFAARLRHLEIDIARWPDRGPAPYSFRCPNISFEKLEYLGFPNMNGWEFDGFPFYVINPLPNTLRTLDLSGWNYRESFLDGSLFPLFVRLSRLE